MKERAKAFAFLSIGILCLAIAVELLLDHEAAADVNPAGSIHALSAVTAQGAYALTTGGEAYRYDGVNWFREPTLDPPLTASAIAMWEGTVFVSTAGDIWRFSGDHWQNQGPLGGGVRTQESSWGEVKSKYGDD